MQSVKLLIFEKMFSLWCIWLGMNGLKNEIPLREWSHAITLYAAACGI